MTDMTRCVCGCRRKIRQPPTGRRRKYLNDNHRKRHFERKQRRELQRLRRAERAALPKSL